MYDVLFVIIRNSSLHIVYFDSVLIVRTKNKFDERFQHTVGISPEDLLLLVIDKNSVTEKVLIF